MNIIYLEYKGKNTFSGKDECMKLKIDRKQHKLWIATSKSNMEYKEVPFTQLFDEVADQIKDKLEVTDIVTDEELIKYITIELISRTGNINTMYHLISKKIIEEE